MNPAPMMKIPSVRMPEAAPIGRPNTQLHQLGSDTLAGTSLLVATRRMASTTTKTMMSVIPQA